MKVSTERYLDSEKKPAVKVTFTVKDKDELDSIFDVEKALERIGVNFDTDYAVNERQRNWYLDWSLKGAKSR